MAARPELGAHDGATARHRPSTQTWSGACGNKIHTAKQLVANEKHVVQQLRASIVNDCLRHSELEEFFLQCTDDVKKETDRIARLPPALLAPSVSAMGGAERPR